MTIRHTRLRDYFAHNPGCAVCEYRNRCAGGCRGRVASVGDPEVDLLARDEDACAFFKTERLEEIVKRVNRVNEGGEGRADEFINRFAEAGYGRV